jgi:hypothetical protein
MKRHRKPMTRGEKLAWVYLDILRTTAAKARRGDETANDADNDTGGRDDEHC